MTIESEDSLFLLLQEAKAGRKPEEREEKEAEQRAALLRQGC